MRTLWCWLTFRHRGHISHDDKGVYWACEGLCRRRSYVPWEEVKP